MHLNTKLKDRVFGTSKIIWVIQLLLLAGLVLYTNHGFFDRVEGLIRRSNWLVLSVYVTIWGLSMVCLAIAAQVPNRGVRLFWALLISLTTAVAHSFHLASGADLNVYYVLSFWTARHEAGRAIEFYQDVGIWVAPVLIAFAAVLYFPATIDSWRVRHVLNRLAWIPAIPIVAMAAILVVRNGSGSQAMPRQFQPLAIGIVAAGRIFVDEAPVRHDVSWQTKLKPAVRHIVLLVDESIRPDYISWQEANPFTPTMAANKEKFANFGQALSGGNCSSISNAILRLGGTRRNFVEGIKTNPTIWQYAKSAGFRTVYVDGQSMFIKSDKKLQNFMSIQELAQIDRHVTFDAVPAPHLDYSLLAAIADELEGEEPVFIYANKNGAHFPYDAGYPESEAIFKPVIGPTGERDPTKVINSYRNVVRWSVDNFFGELLETLDLSHTLIIYTSDHGQHFAKGRLTHCSVENPDLRQALVPLIATTSDRALMVRLVEAARLNFDNISHFAIMPTVLELMGYHPSDIETLYGPSLFRPQTTRPAFTADFIFGLFRSKLRWRPVDLSRDYLEPIATASTADAKYIPDDSTE